MRPLIRTIKDLDVGIDYRPGGVSMTLDNFAKLELDRRMNAERILFLLANVSGVELAKLGIPPDDGHPNALHRQISALDAKIKDLHAAHRRISTPGGKPTVTTKILDSEQWQLAAAMRRAGADERFVDDALFDLRVSR